MNKSELTNIVAKAAGISKASANKAIDGFTGAVSDTLTKGEQVTLVGFGTFQVRERTARSGRNPRTGEDIQIKAAKIPAFKAGKGLKDSVN